MADTNKQSCCEKFKTAIGGQALIEGIMMRGPDKDAVVVRTGDEMRIEVQPRKIPAENSPLRWPLIRGAVNFIDAQITGVKALMRSAELAPDGFEEAEEPSKFEKWIEEKVGSEKVQELVIGFSVVLGLGMSIGLFFLLPMIICSFMDQGLVSTLVEGLIRICIFVAYILLVSRMEEMKRVFAYHGAEHKTIRCYEAGLPLTVDNVRNQTRLHPRCGTSFLLVVMILSILVFSVASSVLTAAVPALKVLQGSVWYRVLMIGFKLALLPLVVAIAYEINRWVGRHDNWFTKMLTFPGMWFQNFTTNEPDDSMIEVAITALEAVLPEEAGADRW